MDNSVKSHKLQSLYIICTGFLITVVYRRRYERIRWENIKSKIYFVLNPVKVKPQFLHSKLQSPFCQKSPFSNEEHL